MEFIGDIPPDAEAARVVDHKFNDLELALVVASDLGEEGPVFWQFETDTPEVADEDIQSVSGTITKLIEVRSGIVCLVFERDYGFTTWDTHDNYLMVKVDALPDLLEVVED